jgi:HNH endonuclease
MAETNHILCACGCQQVCHPGRRWISGHNLTKYHTSFSKRFWTQVERTETCWLWRGYRNANGYGMIGLSSKNMLAHRLSYEMHFGPIPPGLSCCHHCDNPSCVRPEHLFVGTKADNMQDMVRKGRHWVHTKPELLRFGDRNVSRLYPETRPRGEQVKLAKVTAEQVKEIRRLYRDEQWKQNALAAVFGISHRTISLIVRYKTWRHVPDD